MSHHGPNTPTLLSSRRRSFRQDARILIIVVSVCIATVCPRANAAISPFAYAFMQSESPEALKVRVLTVAVNDLGPADPTYGKRVRVDAAAEVLTVTRTASGLKPHDRIR